MTVELEVIPELGVRNEAVEFILGMPIRQAMGCLQRVCRIIKGVELVYGQEEPNSNDVTITLTNDGVRLIFDCFTQVLKIIEVYDLNRATYTYCSCVFSCPTEQATVAKVERSFGATHPGVYDSKQQVYILNWRGLCFSFPTNSVVQSDYAHGWGSLQFPPDSSPLVSKMCIFQGPSLADAKVPEIPLRCFLGNCYLEEARVLRSPDSRTLGLKLRLLAESVGSDPFSSPQIQSFERVVYFGDYAEEVSSSLGSPNRVFYKSEDKMRIHRPSGERHKHSHNVDYFFNYFTLGLDILFDAGTNCAKKFILHTNYPGHFDFGMYDRCNFKLTLENTAWLDEGSQEDLLQGAGTSVLVTPFTKWEEISEVMGDTQPVVLNRSSASSDNPFGSTFSYGSQDLIVEVMKNGHLASVTLFENNHENGDI